MTELTKRFNDDQEAAALRDKAGKLDRYAARSERGRPVGVSDSPAARDADYAATRAYHLRQQAKELERPHTLLGRLRDFGRAVTDRLGI